MKILLASVNRCMDPYPVYPLGISVVARALRLAGHETAQFDCLAEGVNCEAALRAAIETFKPDAIGVSVRNIDSVDSTASHDDYLADAARICRVCRSASAAPLFLGGAGFSIQPDEILAICGADYGIAGPGESAAPRLAAALRCDPPPPKGTVFRENDGAFFGADYDLKILRWYLNEAKCIPVCAKRGCPFSCSYCTYPLLEGRSVQVRDKKSVLDDLTFLGRNFPGAMAVFTDSVFNDPAGSFRELCRTELPMKFSAFITPRGLTESDADALARAGLVHAEVGIDAATDATLRGLNKPFTFREAARACALLRARGVAISVSVMFGGPGETLETLREGVANLKSLEDCRADIFSGIRILPGAPLHRLALREGIVRPDSDLSFGSPQRYYYAPGLDKETVDSFLEQSFRNDELRIFPPRRGAEALRRIHKFGYLRIRSMLAGGKESSR